MRQIVKIRARKGKRRADPICLKNLKFDEIDKLDDKSRPFLIYDEFQSKLADNQQQESESEEEDDVELLYDENDDPNLDYKNRIVIFATQVSLSYLDQCLIWSVDGTFDSAPTFFNQEKYTNKHRKVFSKY